MALTSTEPVDVRATKPADCALAFAIPTTVEGFVRDLSQGRAKDFAHQVSGRPRVMSRERRAFAAETLYGGQAEVIFETMEAVSRLGVNVRTVLSPAGLRPLLEEFDVVTLVTHWRPADFFPDDFLDIPALASQLRGAKDHLSAALWNHLSDATRQLMCRAGDVDSRDENSRKTLADEVNRFLISRHPDNGLFASDGATDGFLAHQRREALDHAYPEAFFPGNRAEFDDGLHTIEDIISHIPDNYAGIFDLTICNSIFLGEEIRKRRPHSGMMVTVEDPTTLSFRLSLFKYAVKVLANGERNYLDVCLELREGIAKGKLFAKKRWWTRLLDRWQSSPRRAV